MPLTLHGRSVRLTAMRLWVGAAGVVVLLLCTAQPAWALQGGAGRQTHRPGEVLVRFEPGASAAQQRGARAQVDGQLERRLDVPGWQLLKLPRGRSVGQAVRRLEAHAAVSAAEPNRLYRAMAIPSDSRFTEQWGLHNTGQALAGVPGTPDADIDAPEAWEISTGSAAVKVAVVDTGVRYDHPELAPNVYAAPDGGRGRDFVDGDDQPLDENGHGTHVAGVIGARGNDAAGVAGLNWNVTLIPVRVLDQDGVGTADAVANGFAAAADMGARVVNASLGGGYSQVIADAIAAAPQTLFVTAAGNRGLDIEETGRSTYPCALPDGNVVCVAATDQRDRLARWSSFGDQSVDLAAPGTHVLSTHPRLRSLFSDDMETDPSGRWIARDFDQPWRWTTTVSNSPTHALSESPGGPFSGNDTAVAELDQRFELTGLHACRIDFWLRLDTGRPRTGSLRVEQRFDGTGFGLLQEYTGSHQDHRSLYFDADAGPGFRFRFAFNRSLGDGSAEGADIDDVALRCMEPSAQPDGWESLSGTSMATPHVAGTAALVWAAQPDATVAAVRSRLLDSVDKLESLAGKVVTRGRLNAHGALTGRVSDPLPTVGWPLIDRVAGSAISSSDDHFAGDGGPATEALLSRPTDVAALADGGFLVSDTGNHRIRRVGADGRIQTIAGTGAAGLSGDGGPATQAQLSQPTDVDLDESGGILIIDYDNRRVRRIAPDGTIATVAGGGSQPAADGARAADVSFSRVGAVAAIPGGGFYLTEADYGRLWRVDAGGTIRLVTADQPVTPDGRVDATADGGYIYAELRRVVAGHPDSQTLRVLAGRDDWGIEGEPAVHVAMRPIDMVVAPDGGLLVTQPARVSRITPDGIYWPAAGTGVPGATGDGWRARSGKVNRATGIDIAGDGTVLVADTDNDRIRRISRYWVHGEPTPGAGGGDGGTTQPPPDGGGDDPTQAPPDDGGTTQPPADGGTSPSPDGSTAPDPAPAPTPPAGPAPVAGSGDPTTAGHLYPAKLQIRRARVLDGKLDVYAPITRRASGSVKVTFHAAGEKTRFTVPVNSERGYVRFQRRLPRKQARLGTGILTLDYPGNPRTRAQEVRLRAASQRAELTATRPVIRNGRIHASGTVSEKARGVVRLQLSYLEDGQQRLLRLRGRINEGRWTITERIPPAALHGGHSYTLFTGYFPRRVRGEMRSYKVYRQR